MCATPEELQGDWPGWCIWRSSGGSWMATRRRILTVDEVGEGLASTLMEDSEHELLAQLSEQQRTESDRNGMTE